LFVGGMTRSMQFTALSTLAFAEVPADTMSGANTLFNMAQQASMGMGIAAGAVALRIAGLFGPNASGSIPLANFHIAFAIIGGVALLAILDVVGLPSTAGNEVRLHKTAPRRVVQPGLPSESSYESGPRKTF
jgi:hypothetical protein